MNARIYCNFTVYQGGDIMVVVAAGILLFPSYTSKLVYGIQFIGSDDNNST